MSSEPVREAAQAFEAAVEAINCTANPLTAFKDATELAAILEAAHREAADLRANAARRIWQAERLSLAALADRIGVSKARADQLVHKDERRSA